MITDNSALLVQILDHLTESVQVCDPAGIIVYCNNKTQELSGYSRNELIGKHISILETSFKKDGTWEKHFESMVSGNVLTNKGIHQDASGRLIPVEASVRKITIDDTEYALAIIRDISAELEGERKEKIVLEILKTSVAITELLLNHDSTQSAIHRSLELLGNTVEVDRVYIFENYIRENEVYSSQTYEWVKEGISKQIHNEDLHDFPFESGFPIFFDILNSGEIINTQVKDMDPVVRPVFDAQEIISLLLIPIRIKERFWGMIGFDSCTHERHWRQDEISFLKITANTLGMFIEKRESFKSLENLVQEKEILLSELHHRTKNNLAIISGIIDLQKDTCYSQDVYAYAETIQQRVQNIALIHDILSSTGKFSKLSFAQYITILVKRLEVMFLRDQNLTRKINIQDFIITDLSQMVSLGILMNEILLNAFKHAFLNHDHPEIEIEAQATVERVLIRIKDNGPGMDPSIVNNATNDSTIGMKVINGLLGQLRSELEISNADGTEFRITLNKLKVTL